MNMRTSLLSIVNFRPGAERGTVEINTRLELLKRMLTSMD